MCTPGGMSPLTCIASPSPPPGRDSLLSAGDNSEPPGEDQGGLLSGARLPHGTHPLPLPGAAGEAGPPQRAEDPRPAGDPGVRGRGHRQTGPHKAPLCGELLHMPPAGSVTF